MDGDKQCNIKTWKILYLPIDFSQLDRKFKMTSIMLLQKVLLGDA